MATKPMVVGRVLARKEENQQYYRYIFHYYLG